LSVIRIYRKSATGLATQPTEIESVQLGIQGGEMTILRPSASIGMILFSAMVLQAQCASDHRTNKNAGILISDFTISGPQTMGATELTSITTDFIDSCFDEGSEELEERVRASFQERGYFVAKVNSLTFKPRDPLGVPKPVTVEADISAGPRFKLADVTFVENHAFPSDILREQFPLKRGDVFSRGKIASGLESLRKLYGPHGFLDYIAIPDTMFASNATANLVITFVEGPQYHMGKLNVVAEKVLEARLRAEWKLAEGDVYDNSYPDQFVDANRDFLPPSFTRADIRVTQNCPEATVSVTLVVRPAEDSSYVEPKNTPCEDHRDRKADGKD
jgi:hypothetical protein